MAGWGASEFVRTWRMLEPSLAARKVVIDLRGVLHMDSEARNMLAEIHSKTSAQFLADTPMTKYFVDEARKRESD